MTQATTLGFDSDLVRFVSLLANPPPRDNEALRFLKRELLTITEAADILHCTEAAVLQRVEDGEILAVSIGVDTMLVAKKRIDRIADLERRKRPAHLPKRR